jgi:hypothetical protein
MATKTEILAAVVGLVGAALSALIFIGVAVFIVYMWGAR